LLPLALRRPFRLIVFAVLALAITTVSPLTTTPPEVAAAVTDL